MQGGSRQLFKADPGNRSFDIHIGIGGFSATPGLVKLPAGVRIASVAGGFDHALAVTTTGQVYAWGMVGSILGTFLTGFFLIDILGTKGVILLLGTVLAFGATMLGSIWHAVWAGIPLTGVDSAGWGARAAGCVRPRRGRF